METCIIDASEWVTRPEPLKDAKSGPGVPLDFWKLIFLPNIFSLRFLEWNTLLWIIMMTAKIMIAANNDDDIELMVVDGQCV